MGCTSETSAFIVKFISEEQKDLACVELSRFADADFELPRRFFGDRDVAVVFREDDRVRS